MAQNYRIGKIEATTVAVGNKAEARMQVIHLGPQANEILALIDRFGGDDTVALQSAVYELEDADAPLAVRSAARGRLKKFLSQLAGSVHDVGVGLLEKYVERKLGL